MRENAFWKAFDIIELIDGFEGGTRDALQARVKELRKTYGQMSDTYQASKGQDDIPLN